MTELLRTSLIWRLCAAFAAWLSGTRLARGLRALGRLWRESWTYRFLSRLLSAEALTDASAYRRLLDRFNSSLQRHGAGFLRVLHESLCYRVYHAAYRRCCESFLLGKAFRSGMTRFLLLIIAAYFPVDWLLRDVLKLSALSSVWDEALMALCLLWILFQRAEAKKPLRSRANSLDVWLALYMIVGGILLLYTSSHPAVNITGYRASMQYILLFFLVLRLMRDERDLMAMYRAMVLIAAVFAVHGIIQFVVGVDIPEHWTDRAEADVRTRVFSVFSNPNIMGAYMLLFAPMAIGLAYASQTPGEKVFYWICGICMCLSCLFTMSRGAWLALVVAAVLFSLIVDRKLFLLLLVFGVAACFLPFVRSRIGYLFTADFAESNARGGREMRWQTAFGYLDRYEAWGTGLGYGMFGGAVAMQNQINPALDYMYVDNYYVKTLAENGIVGLSALCSALAGLLWSGARACGRSGHSRRKPLCAGMLAGLVGILVQSFFESLWEEPYMMALFFAIAAMLIYAGFFCANEEEA